MQRYKKVLTYLYSIRKVIKLWKKTVKYLLYSCFLDNFAPLYSQNDKQ
jgi:hypothetical protein